MAQEIIQASEYIICNVEKQKSLWYNSVLVWGLRIGAVGETGVNSLWWPESTDVKRQVNMDSLAQIENEFALSPPFGFIQALNGLDEAHCTGEGNLLNLLM